MPKVLKASNVCSTSSDISKLFISAIPLEIDGDVFMIHKNVSSLIDNLVLQISDLKLQEKLNARKKSD